MFNRNYFAAREFAPVYFPPVPQEEAEVIAGGRRVFGEPIADANVNYKDAAQGRIERNRTARPKVRRG